MGSRSTGKMRFGTVLKRHSHKKKFQKRTSSRADYPMKCPKKKTVKNSEEPEDHRAGARRSEVIFAVYFIEGWNEIPRP
jgi:hypothetical protein